MGVMVASIPFMVIYLFWVLFFAIMAQILGANASLAEGFEGIGQFMGHFFVTFENSLGNINSPTIDFMTKPNQSLRFLSKLQLYFIYFFWWMAQVLLLVIMLNFVIALISQYYEDVMNSKVMHNYMMRN